MRVWLISVLAAGALAVGCSSSSDSDKVDGGGGDGGATVSDGLLRAALVTRVERM